MDTIEIRCPSGMRGRISKLLGKHFHEYHVSIADRSTPEQMADLASAVWVETIDPGPYQFKGSKPPFRSDVLVGDRSYVLLQSKIFTSGGIKPIRVQCDSCRGWWPEAFDYADLPVQGWPDADAPEPPMDTQEHDLWEARKSFAAGEPCRTEMPDGVVVHWGFLTGSLLAEQVRLYATQFGDSYYSDAAARIVAVDGLEISDKAKPEERRQAIFNWLTSYSVDDFWVLWGDIQGKEAGPETHLLKRCQAIPSCGDEFEFPVDIMGFIVSSLPKRLRRSRAGARR